MAEKKKSQSPLSPPRGRKRDKVFDLFKKKQRSRSPAPSAVSGVSSHSGTPGTPQTRGRVRDKLFNIFKPNDPGSHRPGGSEVPSQLEIPVSLLEVQTEQVPGNQNQHEAQAQALIIATDVGTRGAVVPALGLNMSSPTEEVGVVNNNGDHGQAITGTAEQDPGGENWQDARVPVQMEATDQARGDPMSASAPEAASSLNTGTFGPVMDNHHHQAQISTSAADNVLSAVEHIAQGQNESHGKLPVMSEVRKAFVEGWKGLHKVTEIIEPLLQGTPFKTPITVFNMISTAAETSIDNQDKMQQLLQDIKDYLEIVNKALTQGMRKNQGIKFAKFLVDQTLKLYNMQAQNITKQVITAGIISQHLQDMVAGLDKESQKIQTQLQVFALTESRMNRMFDMWPLARHASYNASIRHDICTPETRVEILARLKDWISDTSGHSPSIFWIRGMAGMGKSTIAKTICKKYSNRVGDCQLGASFFCSRQSAELRSQQNVIPTIVYQLGKRSDTFWDALAAVDEDAVNDPKNHVSSILFEPWQKRSPEESSRWLIVIDALDELDGSGGSLLLQQLLKGISRDKINGIKILITGRPDQTITKVCNEELSNEAICKLEDVETSQVAGDISKYIQQKLPFLIDGLLAEFVNKCDGLFIYAATVIREVLNDGGSTVELADEEKLTELKKHLLQNILSKDSGINALYQTIVEKVLGLQNSERYEKHRKVLGAIICAKQPLRVNDLARLLEENTHTAGESLVLRVVKALHATVYIRDERIYIYHKSFHEFFEKEFVGLYETLLAKQCLRIMLHSLHFNMCDLPSSYLLDSEVPDLPSTVNKELGNEIGYAVCYGIAHIIQVSENEKEEVLKLLRDFEEKQIIFWIEAMNLLKKGRECWDTIKKLQAWIYKCKGAEDHRLILSETEKLVKLFTQTPTSLSTPHLYISSLAIEAETTGSSAGWQKLFGNIPKVKCRGVSNHGGVMLQIEGAAPITTVALSPDGSKIVSGSYDETVRIWDAVAGQQLAQLGGHTGGVTSVAFSPDGSKIVSGSYDETVRIWDAVAGQQLAQLGGHTGGVTSVAFSPDGSKIVSGSYDETVRIWDAVAGQQLAQLGGHTGGVTSVAFSPDGSKIVSGSYDETVRIWDAVAGQQLAQLDGHSNWVYSVAFSPDGSKIVSGSYDEPVRIWDAVAGQQLGQLDGHTGDVTSVAFSPDGSKIVSGSRDETVRIWDAVAGQQLAQLDGHSDWVNSVAFSPDGSKIVSGSFDKTVRIWDAVAGQQLAQLDGHTGGVNSVAFSPDGSKIVSGSFDKTVRIWDAVAGQQLAQLDGHSDWVNSVAFSPDGSKIVSGSRDETVRIWDAVAGQQLAQLDGHSDWVNSVALSPDGSKIVSGSRDETVRIWDAVAGQQLAQLDGHTGDVTSVAFSPDGSKIVSGSFDKTVRIWDAVAGQLLAQLDGHSDWVNSVAFSPDGSKIVSGSRNETVRIWDAVAGQQLAQLDGHTGDVTSVAFSPDGSKIVSGSFDKTVRIWDAVAGQQLAQLDGHTGGVTSVAFSPDGSKIVSGSRDETVRIWDAVAGQQLAQLDGHTGDVTSVAFSPDGSKIVSGSFDKTVRIWDAVAGQQLAQLDGHSDWVNSVAFSPDGSKIVSGSRDETVRIWDAVAGQQLAHSDGRTSLVITAASPPDQSNIFSSFHSPTASDMPDHITNVSKTIQWQVNPQQWLCVSGERLMWMPPPLISSLLPRFCLMSLSRHPSTHVSLDQSFLGPNWTNCYTPSSSVISNCTAN
ncbi:hypothetical protein D9757_009930 [Collybiopsis confluens]|uniref:NACHT domain-containing protein n=1 Tax=Collybiopsis confluens TaxID=2823264 RepID=A0A8H5GWU6_9AGAR|nr:hypothetical protein D9757_009930 [Collybiopsis confluens]